MLYWSPEQTYSLCVEVGRELKGLSNSSWFSYEIERINLERDMAFSHYRHNTRRQDECYRFRQIKNKVTKEIKKMQNKKF